MYLTKGINSIQTNPPGLRSYERASGVDQDRANMGEVLRGKVGGVWMKRRGPIRAGQSRTSWKLHGSTVNRTEELELDFSCVLSVFQ